MRLEKLVDDEIDRARRTAAANGARDARDAPPPPARERRDEAREAVLTRADVIVATLAGAGERSFVAAARRVLKDSPPCLLIIDEAAQATEPQAQVPLRFVKPQTRVVLCGDQMQLRPLTLEPTAERAGYSTSLFARLWEGGAGPSRAFLLSLIHI